jgi:hypothetical protein
MLAGYTFAALSFSLVFCGINQSDANHDFVVMLGYNV